MARGMGVELDPDWKQQDPRLRRLGAWWEDACAALGHLPGRQHVDPAGWRGLLAHLYMIDVIEDGKRYRWRLIGTAVTELAGRDATGRYMDDLYDVAGYAEATKSYAAVVASRRPLRSFGTLAFTGRDYSGFDSVEVPLAADGARIDLILGMCIGTR